MKIDLAEVKLFIQEGHEGQRYDDAPYWQHPVKALERAIQLFQSTDPEIVNDLEFQAACLTHDLAEDQSSRGYTLEEIEKRYGPAVSKYVFYVTKPEHPPELKALRGAPRRAAKLVWNQNHYRWQAIYGPRQSHLIKIADRDVNIDGLNAANFSEDFRQFYINDTTNLVNEYRQAGIRGIEHVESRLRKLVW